MMTDLEHELMVANETIREAEESFAQLRGEYQALRKHTDELESILKEHGIPCPAFWGW
jgi:predicted  nucleic acid-binding Zn-ribbon protein